MKVREIIKRIEADGWKYSHTRGDHRVYKHPVKPGNVVVVGRLSADPPTGTQANIWKQAGLPKP